MKKIILSALSVIVIGSIIFISCKPKNDNDAITPTYKDEASSGTGADPNITNVTTTGTIATTSTQQNSTIPNINAVGSPYLNSPCQTGQTCFSSYNTSTSTTITVCFSAPPTAGPYTLVNSSGLLGPGKALITVTNPPSQDANSVWTSGGGTVNVSTASGVEVSFSNIACYRSIGSFYTVTISGKVLCN
ncbi:MAG: hypothetical protein IPH32_03095 [Bacteroidetes bacterium]|nr:hypothetical protein [Bacteroidota bacterium]